MGDVLEPLLIEYKAKNGQVLVFDIGADTLKPYDYNYADRVETPKGLGTVIGYRDKNLWFHCDSDPGASFWDNAKNYEDLVKLGITRFETPMVIDLTESNGVYKLKRVSYRDKNVNVILQNENGPCPLISICNVLALRGDITISPAGEPDTSRSIDIIMIKILLSDLLNTRSFNQSEPIKKAVAQAIEQLDNLQTGMDVNFGFQQPDSFEKSEQSAIFELLGVRLVHGWLVNPVDVETLDIIGNCTHDELMNKLVALDQPPPTQPSSVPSPTSTHQTPSSPNANQPDSDSLSPLSPSSPPSASSPNPSAPSPKPSQSSEPSSSPAPLSPARSDQPTNGEAKKTEDVKPPTAHEGEIINEFFRQNSTQLTSHGLIVLLNSLHEDELCVFFRNNHFATLTRHNNQLYILVTDIGYERERTIVWDLLNSVDGSSIFTTGDFKPTDDEKREEIVNTLEIMGFGRERIEECYKSAPREKLVNADDGISFLLQILQKGIA